MNLSTLSLLPIVLFFQILNTSNMSQAVTLFYVVRNESTVLNGTVSSNLLNQLSAELVGFYLTFPPLTIAEGKSLYYSPFYCSIFILFKKKLKYKFKKLQKFISKKKKKTQNKQNIKMHWKKILTHIHILSSLVE